MKIKKIVVLFLISSLFISCFEDLDDVIKPASPLEIQNFVYRGLNYFYLYKADTPELANDAFSSQEAKENFLKRFDSPESLFEYLRSPQDRFSRIFDDYIVIENALAGVSMSNGMEYGLVYFPDNSRNVFGYVRYILPNTDAETKGLQRGQIFTTVDGVQLNENNYNDLLSRDSYSLGFATYDGTTFQPTGDSVQLTKTQYDENPVFIAKTLDLQGQKIGYLMYNAFIRGNDTDLNNAFATFKSNGITDLILDLRYNGGGSVETATDLASMITGQFNGQVFYKEFWNADRQADYARSGLFDSQISNGAPINSLNLSTVYVLTSSNTASASELVINGLDPYINVVQIGDATTGKFQASFLMYDAPAPNFSKNQASLSHRYVMLPLVFKTSNKVGHTDFNEGLMPDVALKEDFLQLGELGDPSEPLLSEALNSILGLPRDHHRSFQQLKEISGSEKDSPLHGIMIANQDLGD